ncbi:DNA-binding transcriptional MocR family regulator [Mucilaginibacter sp. UYNi724]
MLPYKTLVVIDHNSTTPFYKQIYIQVIGLIQQGFLRAGNRLPGTRELAQIMGVHRNTIIAAYEELSAQNWIETIPRKGTQVALNLPEIKPRTFNKANAQASFAKPTKFQFTKHAIIDKLKVMPVTNGLIVNDGFPDIDLAPFDLLFKLCRRQLNGKKVTSILSSSNAGGSAALRTASCSFLNETRGLNITEENIIITRGAQMAIYIAASLILKPGDQVLVSDPSYLIADDVFTSMGAKLIRVPVDSHGMDVDVIEKLLKTTAISLLYIIPHHHHPTTVTMSTARRIRLLQLIKEFGIPVIEDDYDYDFHYQNSPVIPLAAGDHGGNIIYVGSYTKLLAPNFRLGYLIASANFVEQAIYLRKLMDLRGDTLMEDALATMIGTGELARHIKKSLKIYSRRCDLICKLLAEQLGDVVGFTKPQGGLAIWIKFKQQYPLKTVIEKARAKGLLFSGSAYYRNENQRHNAIRFGFASLTPEKIVVAIGIIRDCTVGQ